MGTLDRAGIAAIVRKSGFVLEHEVTDMLRARKWTVINNKYYLDDVQGVAREVDIIAYRVSESQDVQFYTTLVISCKKSAQNSPAIISRDVELSNPNLESFPVKVWSNDKVLRFMLSSSAWQGDYVERTKAQRLYSDLIDPSGQLIGIQEIKRSTGDLKSDRTMFPAIAALMKAQAYELGSLDRRKQERAVYNFNLLSISDGELFDVRLRGGEIDPQPITSARYVVNYIINRQETASRIHFVDKDSFEKTLGLYDELHSLNMAFFRALSASYYPNAIRDVGHVQVFWPDFEEGIRSYLNYRSREVGGKGEYAGLGYSIATSVPRLEIELPGASTEEVAALNADARLVGFTGRLLQSLYHYKGECAFAVETELPF